MITASTEIILRAVVFSFAFGVLSSSLYCVLNSIFRAAGRFIKAKRTSCKKSSDRAGLIHNLIDYLFLTACAGIYIIATYVLSDGILNVYSVFALLLGIICAKCFFDSFFRTLFRHKN